MGKVLEFLKRNVKLTLVVATVIGGAVLTFGPDGCGVKVDPAAVSAPVDSGAAGAPALAE